MIRPGDFTLTYEQHEDRARCIVQIEENGEFKPYIVLTNHYDGKCLLVREHLLDGTMLYNHNYVDVAYYPDSLIDQYLEYEFPLRFSDDFRQYIPATEIKVTTKDSLFTGRPKTETISRHCFLLSFSDVDGSSMLAAKEGKGLKYFRKVKYVIAYHEDGTPDIWWLRTPQTWYDTIVFAIWSNGAHGTCSIANPNSENECAVCPAFCLDGSMSIIEQDGKYYLEF